MKNIKVVIGANFGDEGKGIMTDYLASSIENGIVVRFNGGAQAGHAVTTYDGLRHVFGHVGSGTFAGLPSYLSSFFVVNPMLFVKEIKELNKLGLSPKVFIDRQCTVTTPFDMMINQIAEITRGALKHGSCGVGFNETITRCESDRSFMLCVSDLMDEFLLKEKLGVIKDKYVYDRLRQLGIDSIDPRYESLLKDDRIIYSYLEDVRIMLDTVSVTDINILNSYDSILFEGAQGLLLDQSHEYFPHVTRSNTGMKNVTELIYNAGMHDETIEIVYVTRAYLTRHGVGPFPTELPEKPYQKIEDRTNVPNPYQDALRYGLVDIDVLADIINRDLKNAEGIRYKAKLAVTCLDQLDEEVDFILDCKKEKASSDVLVRKALEALNVKGGYLSYGLTRDTIYKVVMI